MRKAGLMSLGAAQPQENNRLRVIATCVDDAAAWCRIEREARLRAHAAFGIRGRELPGLGGILYMPLDALPALAPARELDPTDPMRLASRLREAWSLLDHTWPEAGRETRYFVLAVASGCMPAGRQCSGSSEQHPFAIRIDFCASDPAHLLADAIVHEAAHVKLRLAHLLSDMCGADDTPRLHHPWKSELRPLSAVFVACHAFVAVHGFHARRCALGVPGAAAIEATLRAEVAESLDTLAGAGCRAEAGRSFVALLREAHSTHCGLADAGRSAP